MPPVQIPTIQRVQPQNEASVGRIEAKPINIVQGQAGVNEAITSLAKTGIDIWAKYEDQAASTAAKSASVEYHQYLEKKLEGDPTAGVLGLKHFQGDPTEAYQQFDTDSMKKQVEIQGRYSDASSTTKFKVQQHLQEVSANFFDRKTIDYGNQLSQYTVKTTKAYGEQLLQNTVAGSGLLNASKPDTLKAFNAGLIAIAQNAVEGADAVGLPSSHPSVKMSVFEQQSKAIVDTAKVLIKSKKIKEAQMVMDKYKGQIDSSKIDEITGELHKATVEQKALDFVNTNRSKGPEALWNSVGNIKDLEIRKEAELMITTKQHQISFFKKEKEDVNNDRIMKYTMERQLGQIKGAVPFESPEEAERDPNISPFINKISPEQRKSFRKYLTTNEESDPVAVNNLNELYTTEQFVNIPAGDFEQLTIGLNKTDKNKFWNLRRSAGKIEENELNRRAKQAYQAFVPMAEIEFELISRVKPGRSRDEEDAAKLNIANEYFIANSASLPTDPKQLQAFVKNYAIRLKNQEAPGFFSFFSKKKEQIPETDIPKSNYKQYLPKNQNTPIAPPIKPTSSNGVVVPVKDTKALMDQKAKALSANATDIEKVKYFYSVKGNYPINNKQLSDFLKSEMPQ